MQPYAEFFGVVPWLCQCLASFDDASLQGKAGQIDVSCSMHILFHRNFTDLQHEILHV